MSSIKERIKERLIEDTDRLADLLNILRHESGIQNRDMIRIARLDARIQELEKIVLFLTRLLEST